jgi:hypothetical protein
MRRLKYKQRSDAGHVSNVPCIRNNRPRCGEERFSNDVGHVSNVPSISNVPCIEKNK